MTCMAQCFLHVYGMSKDILLDFRFSVHFCVEQVSQKEAFWLAKSFFRAVLKTSSKTAKGLWGLVAREGAKKDVQHKRMNLGLPFC